MAGLNKVMLIGEDIAGLYESGMSLPAIAKRSGAPVSTVRRELLRYGVVLRGRVEGLLLAMPHRAKRSSRKLTPKHKEALSRSRRAWADEHAAGRSLKPSGYVEITRGPNKGRPEHVVLVEEMIGRRLNKGEVVHHINEVKDDNRLENLTLMSEAEHLRIHREQDTSRRERNANGRFA